MSTAQLISEALSLEGMPKNLTKFRQSKKPVKIHELECDSQRIDDFQENLQKLVPSCECDELSDPSTTPRDEEITNSDAESDMKLILEVLEKGERMKRNANKTFPDEKLRDIERRNAILMEKILAHNRRPSQYNIRVTPSIPKTTSAAINRRKAQQKIDHDNLILLRKIQTVKPFGLSRPKGR